MLKSRLLGAVGIVAVAGSVLVAQTPAGPAFEVTSVKPNPSNRSCVFEPNRPGQAYVKGCPLARLIQYWYELPDYQVVGVPSWNASASFDINATFPAGGSPTRHEALVMIQHLLADRFALAVHRETRQLPVYALVVARRDGSLGGWMKRSTIDCAKWITEKRSQMDEGVPSALTPDHKRPACMIRPGADFLVGGTQTTTEIATALERVVGRPVVDRTGLTGAFDFDLKFSRSVGDAATPDTAATPNDATSIYTALQEQLGLKLESTKGPVDVLVIDHIEHPTPD